MPRLTCLEASCQLTRVPATVGSLVHEDMIVWGRHFMGSILYVDFVDIKMTEVAQFCPSG